MKQVEHTNNEQRMLQKVKYRLLITLWGNIQGSRALYVVVGFIEGGELITLLTEVAGECHAMARAS